MLILARSMGSLRFGELAQVYEQSLKEAASDYSRYPSGLAMQMAELDFRQYLQEVFFPTEGALCALWEVNGHYVSALRLEPYRDGLLLEGLETAPEQRHRGYGAALIQAVLGTLPCGKVYSHVRKANAISRKTHEKCGFRQISDSAAYIDGSVDRRCCTLVYEIEAT